MPDAYTRGNKKQKDHKGGDFNELVLDKGPAQQREQNLWRLGCLGRGRKFSVAGGKGVGRVQQGEAREMGELWKTL